MRRHVTSVLCFLIVGLVTTIAVSWLCRVVVDPGGLIGPAQQRWSHPRAPSWTISVRHLTGAIYAGAVLSKGPVDAETVLDERLPDWSSVQTLPAHADSQSSLVIIDFAYGWPLPCLWYNTSIELSAQPDNTASRRIRTGGVWTSYGLPLRPIWWALGLNLIFYALLWVLLLQGVPWAIQRLRHRAGTCRECGYDLTGLTSPACPECGASVAPEDLPAASSEPSSD